ncbi:MAG: hypothetical protein ACFE9I_05510 [Candidatus Hermodarchaeota archaeon]
MIKKFNIHKDYVGPKALFDPNYIPPRLLYRKKEEDSLFSVLNDSISDGFYLNVLYEGINGIGKKVIVNKVINDLLNRNEDIHKINKICVDCREKKIEELIFSLLSELNNQTNLKIDFRFLLNSDIHTLWNTFKFICNKTDSTLFIVFNNIEYLEPEIFNKFLQFGKESKINLISTVNKILRPGTLDLLSEFDFKNKLNLFSYHELYSILKQRVLLSFSREIDKDLVKYITDLVCEQYVSVPGKGIEILRDLYPILKSDNLYSNIELLEISQNLFDSFQISDEFSMLNYLSEEDILTVIFLDNLSNFFISKRNFYISVKELEELYEISCEMLEYEKNFNEFHKLIETLLNIGIIKPSKRRSHKLNVYNRLSNHNFELFFILLNPKQIKIIIDTIFNQ